MAALPEIGIQKVRGPGTCTVTLQEVLMLMQLVYQPHLEKRCLALPLPVTVPFCSSCTPSISHCHTKLFQFHVKGKPR